VKLDYHRNTQLPWRWHVTIYRIWQDLCTLMS